MPPHRLSLMHPCSRMSCPPLQAMAIDAKVVLACDKKNSSQKVMKKQLLDACIFADIEEHSRGSGVCLTHGRHCSVKNGNDLVSVGLPCHPFSDMRCFTGKTPDTGIPEEHREWDLVMKKFNRLVESRDPGATEKSKYETKNLGGQ